MNPKKIIISFFVTICVLVVLFVLPVAFGFTKTGKNTTILGRDFSLLKKQQIINRLQDYYPQLPNIVLLHENRQFIITPESFLAQINYQKTASNLLYRRLNQGIVNYISAFFKPKDFSLVTSFDSSVLDQKITSIASQIDRPFIPSELNLDDRKLINLKNGQEGLATNQVRLKQLIANALDQYLSTPIIVPTSSIGSLPNSPSVDQTKARAQKLIGKKIQLTGHYDPIIIDDKTLISWLGFDETCRSQPITEYVISLATSVKKDPVDAVFKFENSKVLEFKSSSDGYTLNQSQLNNLLCPEIEKLIDSKEIVLSLALPLDYQKAKVTTSEVNNLGIKELIGHGESTFRHSNATRNFNVEKGASIINRLLVAPGETFSFVKNLGEVTLDNGFKKAYIIRAGKTELDVGGGICQVSTTFFRALLNAGLDIIERKNHAYRVSYYEEDLPPGYDATVFIPSPDLKFINDTGHYILIQSTYDGVRKKLSYDLYGTSDGRQTVINNYRRWDAAPAPPDVYIDDPTLPPGKIIQDEHAIPGLKTAFDWKVTRDGQIIHQKTFQSNYVPWAAVYRRGPQI